MNRLWVHLSNRRRWQFCFVLLLMFFASFAEIMSVGAVIPFIAVITDPSKLFQNSSIQFINNVLDIKEPHELVLPITIAFISATLIAGGVRLLLLYATTRLAYGTGHDLSIQVYRRTLYQDYSVHVARNSSEVINGIVTKTGTVISGVITPVLTLISSMIITIGIVGLLCFISFFATMTAFIGFGILYLAVIYYTRKKLITNSEIIAHKSNSMVKVLQEGLTGIKDVIIHDSQELYSKAYQEADLPYRNASGNNLFISGCPRFIMESIGMILIAVIAYFMTKQGSQLSSSLPILGALALGAQRFLPVMQQAYGAYSILKGSKSSLDDVNDLLDQPIPEDAGKDLEGLITFKKAINLENVSFRYDKDGPWILDSINLNIIKGSRVGIIGSTGSGKTTLFDLIIGLFKPSRGKVKVDDNVINEKNIRQWRARVAHVPQEIYLSDNSVLENIAFGIPVELIDVERVKRAARSAQIDKVIENLDNKYETLVGEHGVRLSGGQRQRIGIARALYKQADVLIFDEATSALDTKTERSVVTSIEGLDKELTILIIAHRLSTLKNCDQIIEITNKKAIVTTFEKAEKAATSLSLIAES